MRVIGALPLHPGPPRGHRSPASASRSPWGSPEPYPCTRVPKGVIGAPPLYPGTSGGSPELCPCTCISLGVTRVVAAPAPAQSRPTSRSTRYLQRRRGSVMLRGAGSSRSSGCRKLQSSSSAASCQLAKQAGPRRWISSVRVARQHVPAWLEHQDIWQTTHRKPAPEVPLRNAYQCPCNSSAPGACTVPMAARAPEDPLAPQGLGTGS